MWCFLQVTPHHSSCSCRTAPARACCRAPQQLRTSFMISFCLDQAQHGLHSQQQQHLHRGSCCLQGHQALLSTLLCLYVQADEVTFTTKTDKLIRGDTIILDVSSLHPQSASSPLYGTEQGCSEGCRKTPGCNAWAVCADPAGCGLGCLTYTQDHPQSKHGLSFPHSNSALC
jgi:hypothetical protein